MGVLIFLVFLVLLPAPIRALSPEYEVLIEKNPFSPERQYVPGDGGDSSAAPARGKKEDLRRELLLRGTFFLDKEALALIEVRPGLKRRWQLEKDRFLLKPGEKLGPCVVEEIRRGEVVFSGCGLRELSLADAPERQRPLPPPPKAPAPKASRPEKTAKAKEAPKAKGQKTAPRLNPFKKILGGASSR